MGYIKGSTKLLLCQILQGKVRNRNWIRHNSLFKVYHCTQLILGSALIDVRDKNLSFNMLFLFKFRAMIHIVHLVNKN
jgi:hypothetical protein